MFSSACEASTSTDEQLLGAIAEDPAALGPLYTRHAERVFGLALAILGSREEAEDLTHEIFVSLCRRSTYDAKRGSAGAFLTILTRSRAIDRLRRRHCSARLLVTWDAAALSPALQTLPSEQVSQRRAAERVRVALDALPAALRQVVELAYYRGLTQCEIATELGRPLGTVKDWSRRALLALGHALEDVAN